MIYKRQMREWEKAHGNLDHFRFQPVLPIVLYTGTRTWDKLARIWELVELGDELAELIPEFKPLFLNVGQISRQALEQKGSPFGRLLGLVQQRRTRLKVFEETLQEVLGTLNTLADQDRQRWLELLSYIAALIYNERDLPEREPLVEKVVASVQHDPHRQEIFDMGKTIAEYLREEGREEGRQQGEVRTQRRLLLRLLRNKFGKVPARIVKRIEAVDQLRVLDAWFDDASTAARLEDLTFAAE
jgi:hypothetical protein